MASKILIFAGAPESSSLDWDSPSLFLDLQEPLAQFAGLVPAFARPSVLPSSRDSVPSHAVWRSLPLEKGHLPSGLSQRINIEPVMQLTDDSHFFNTSFTSALEEEEGEGDGSTHEVVSQFYEHSLAIHDEIPSSQLIPTSVEKTQGLSFMTSESSIWTPNDSHDISFKEPIGRQADGDHLSDLEGISPAAHLLRIQPQTMTVNLVVGVISIAAPRTVKTRWGSPRTLVEVLVGDETRSGFAITFWLQSDNVHQSVLAGLRPQDVVLLQNVALNVFMGKVYGSSLRKDLTKVHLLYRKIIDATDTAGYYTAAHLASTKLSHPQLDKTRRVREWVLKFVGVGSGVKATERSWDRPPVDTQ